MRELGIGIIGAGFMGRTFAEAFSKYVTGARLVAVAGGSRAPGLAADYGVAVERAVADLVARPDIDAVVIATPHSVHAEQGVLAARHGKHVLMDKPLATSLVGCDAVIDACRTAGVALMVGQSQRFRQVNRMAKEIIDRDIGRVLMVRESILNAGGLGAVPPWQSEPENLGTLFGYGVHNTDRLLWLTGQRPVSVAALAGSFQPGARVETSSMLLVSFDGGAMAQLWSSWDLPGPGLPGHGFRAQVIGEKGMLDIDGYGELRASRDGSAWETLFIQPPVDWRNEKFAPVRMESYGLQSQAFVDAVRTGSRPAVTGEEGRAAVQLALAAYRAAREEQVIHL